MYALRFQLSEFRGFHANVWDPDSTVLQTEGVLISDSKNLYDRLNTTIMTLSGAEKRSDIETLCLKESLSICKVSLRWVNGESQLANSLTKFDEPQQILIFNNRNGHWRIVYDDDIISGKRRRQMGLDPLETQTWTWRRSTWKFQLKNWDPCRFSIINTFISHFWGYLGSSTPIHALEGKAGPLRALGFAYIYMYVCMYIYIYICVYYMYVFICVYIMCVYIHIH